MMSVYDVSEEEGGRSKYKDNQRSAATGVTGSTDNKASSKNQKILTEGDITIEMPGWFFSSYVKRYVVIKEGKMFCFEVCSYDIITISSIYILIFRYILYSLTPLRVHWKCFPLSS